MTRALALLLAAAALAGCASPLVDTAASGDTRAALSSDWARRALPDGQDHDHLDVTHHQNLTTPNFQVLGWDPLLSDTTGGTPGGHLCGETATSADGRRIAVVNSISTDVVFTVVDVTDASAPTKIGELALERAMAYDVAVTPDARFVVIGANPKTGDVPGNVPVAAPWRIEATWRDACTGAVRAVPTPHELAVGPAAILVSIEDPENPVVVDWAPQPVFGPHSVASASVDGATYIIASVTNLQQQASYFSFFEVAEGPLGAQLAPLSTYAPPPMPGNAPLFNFHNDGSMQKHPVTGQVLAYLADWNGGVIILDMTNPRVPLEVARWSNGVPTPVGELVLDPDVGGIHGTLPIEGLWDDRHYVLAGQEIVDKPSDRPSGWIHILDTTDPANPVEVGRWTIPVDVDWRDGFLRFSTHYFEIVDRTLFVSTYHGGVWAVDLSSPENLSAPKSVGVFVPDRASPSPAPDAYEDQVLDVLALPDGDLVAYASESGVYTLRFDPTYPIEAPEPWPAEGASVEG